ncbi:MAG: DNRLRE domain-containing protein [Candidatus Sumerlaeaceae bacterium]|nr:DNRLRE domain-containing protein [Candidatus Sumerlaeaceae bacterium]
MISLQYCLCRCVGLFILFAGPGQVVFAQTSVTITGRPATAEATIYAETPNDNGGSGTVTRAGRTNTAGAFRRTLIRFDVSGIPASAVITSAALELTISNVNGGAPAAVHALHRVTQPWVEGTGVAAGGGGQVTTGAVCWIARQYGSQNWSAAGGDYLPTPSATVNVGTTLGLRQWSSAGLVADIQTWVGGAATNYGWILIGDETLSQSVRGYTTSEAASDKPTLIINYSPPASVEAWEGYGAP